MLREAIDPGRVRELVEHVRRIEIKTRKNANDAHVGRYRSAFRGQGLDFEEVREYVPGDDTRSIDWNVTAREGRPFVKKYREERELTMLLVVDVSASNRYGSGVQSKGELAAEIASSLALSAARSDDKVGLLTFTDQVESFVDPRKGAVHGLRIVRDILGAQPASRGTDLGKALRVTSQRLARRAVVVIMSDFRGGAVAAGTRDAMRLLALRHDVVAIVLRDPREERLPNVGLLSVEDAETGELLEIDTRSRRVRDAFVAAARQQREELTQWLRRDGVDHLVVTTGAPWWPELSKLFEQRKRRYA